MIRIFPSPSLLHVPPLFGAKENPLIGSYRLLVITDKNRNLLITIADGEDTKGGSTPTEILTAANAKPAEIHNIGLGSSINLEFKTINHPIAHRFVDLCPEFKLKKFHKKLILNLVVKNLA